MTAQHILDAMRFDMELAGLSKATIQTYLHRVKAYQEFWEKPADQMGENDVREFLHHHLVNKSNMASTVNTYNTAIRFLYDVTLDKPLNHRKVPMAKRTRRLPDLPDKDDLRIIFANTYEFKYRAIFITIYGSGLRVSEAANLRIRDIDSKNMRIFIRQGKGNKDRFALLPQRTLTVLREYYKVYKPKEWLFENANGGRIAAKSIQIAFKATVESSGIHKHLTVHSLRHAFATHLLNEGKNILQIKKLLGHVRLDTTTWYLHLSDSETLHLTSPLDTAEALLSDGEKPPIQNV